MRKGSRVLVRKRPALRSVLKDEKEERTYAKANQPPRYHCHRGGIVDRRNAICDCRGFVSGRLRSSHPIRA